MNSWPHIVLLTWAWHTGKTVLAQKLLEKYRYPYLSIDHLKMGLIRSWNTDLTPTSNDEELTEYLRPIVREIIKTAIENNQNLVIEWCYIPFSWKNDFEKKYLDKIKYYCLIMSEKYVKGHFDDIKKYWSIIENRLDDDCNIEDLLEDNKRFLELAKANNLDYILIDDKYEVDINL